MDTTQEIWKVLVVKKLLLTLLLCTPTLHCAQNATVSNGTAIAQIEKMLPRLDADGKRRAQLILAHLRAAKNSDECERIWQQIIKQAQPPAKQPVSLAKLFSNFTQNLEALHIFLYSSNQILESSNQLLHTIGMPRG